MSFTNNQKVIIILGIIVLMAIVQITVHDNTYWITTIVSSLMTAILGISIKTDE